MRKTGENRALTVTAAPASVALDFQSDAQAIEQRALPASARLTLWGLLAIVVVGLIWAALAQVDRVVTARGKLVTTAPTVLVQPLEISVIRSIDVQVGNIVRKGDVLARLDPTFAEADVGQLRDKIAGREAEIARLEAEIAFRPYTPTGSPPSRDEVLQSYLFARRNAELAAKIAAFDSQIGYIKASIATKTANREALRVRLNVVNELETMRAQLFDKNLGSKINLLDAKAARLEVERTLQLSENEISELKQQAAKTLAERDGAVEEWRRKAADDLLLAQRDWDVNRRQLEKAEKRNSLVELTAPVDAVVLDVADRSVGSVLKDAEPFITLVPLDVPLEAEIQINAEDIGQVAGNSEASLKLDAYPFQKHGMLEGQLRTISDDAFTDKAAAQKPPYYRARIALSTTSLRDTPASFRLIPGMTVTADIKSGRRSILSYFTYPLIRGFSEGIREP